jgi:hypothetical protein
MKWYNIDIKEPDPEQDIIVVDIQGEIHLGTRDSKFKYLCVTPKHIMPIIFKLWLPRHDFIRYLQLEILNINEIKSKE